MITETNGPLHFSLQKENLTLEVTNRCVSSCSHCFVRAKGSNYAQLDIATVKSILDEAYSLGYRNIHLTGGEPLIWEYFFDSINYAIKTGFQSFFINTSGILLSRDMCSRLNEYGKIISLSISVQGPKELHEKIRGLNSYQIVIDGIEQSLKAGIEVNIFTSVGKSLVPHLVDYVHDMYKQFNNINSITFIQLIRVAGDIFNHSEELLTPDDFIQFIKITTLLNIYGYTIFILENPLAAVVAEMLHTPWLHPSPPLHRSGRLVILADSSMTFSHSSDLHLGYYKPGLLEQTITSTVYKHHTSQDNKTCEHCTYLAICRNNNLLRPSEWYRDMHPEIPYCQRVLAAIKKQQ